MPQEYPVNKRSFLQRLFGKCITQPPTADDAYTVEENEVRIDTTKLDFSANGAVRIERETPPVRLLIVRDDSGEYHVFENACTHGKRRLDPVPGHDLVQCCSIGKSTFDLDGRRLAGSAEKDLKKYTAELTDRVLKVKLT